MVIPSTSEGITERVSKMIPKFKLSDILSLCKFQTTFIAIPIYFQMISIKKNQQRFQTFFPELFLNRYYFYELLLLQHEKRFHDYFIGVQSIFHWNYKEN